MLRDPRAFWLRWGIPGAIAVLLAILVVSLMQMAAPQSPGPAYGPDRGQAISGRVEVVPQGQQPTAEAAAGLTPGDFSLLSTPVIRPTIHISRVSCLSIAGTAEYEGVPLQDFLLSGVYYPPDGVPRPLPSGVRVPGPDFDFIFQTRLLPGTSEVRISVNKPGLGTSIPTRIQVTC